MSELDRLAQRPEWWQYAECRGLPVDLFFDRDRTWDALKVCEECEVRQQCADAAVEEERVDALVYVKGVRGGMTAEQRRKHIRSLPDWQPARQPAPCGTDAGYNRHRYAGEDACAACKAAHSVTTLERKRNGRPELKLAWAQRHTPKGRTPQRELWEQEGA